MNMELDCGNKVQVGQDVFLFLKKSFWWLLHPFAAFVKRSDAFLFIEPKADIGEYVIDRLLGSEIQCNPNNDKCKNECSPDCNPVQNRNVRTLRRV